MAARSKFLRGSYARPAHENLHVRHVTGVVDHPDNFLDEIVGAAIESYHRHSDGVPVQEPELDGHDGAILKDRIGKASKSPKRGANLFVMRIAVEQTMYFGEEVATAVERRVRRTEWQLLGVGDAVLVAVRVNAKVPVSLGIANRVSNLNSEAGLQSGSCHLEGQGDKLGPCAEAGVDEPAVADLDGVQVCGPLRHLWSSPPRGHYPGLDVDYGNDQEQRVENVLTKVLGPLGDILCAALDILGKAIVVGRLGQRPCL